MADRFEQARQIAARYWQGIGTAITGVVAVVVLFYDPSKWPIAIVSALLVIAFLRFPRIAVRLTRWILGPPPAVENPPRIFRGPVPYAVGENLPARNAEIEQCWLLLQQKPFFTLEGESGCGKSSLLASALLPRARENFKVIECRVENDPMGRLAASLREESYRRSDKEITPEDLRAAIVAAGAPPKETKGAPRKPLLISIDQFEELFVTARDEKRRSLMIVLRDAIDAGEARVLLAIRSDFQDLLLALCREVDPKGSALDLGSYFALNAFSRAQARAALGEMLAPLHGGDPLKRQPLEDFADALVEDLLRPPRDRRLSREDEKTVLPVELQMVGLMLEAVGGEVFSAEAFRRRGGKAELLRKYIEDAKGFVWRRTGVSGDQALLILRKLISPARTKWPQTAAAISAELGFSSAEVELVLEAFAERFLVKALPADEAGQTRYELMHEHLVQVLVEAPQPILQKARDAEERLRFWEERAAATFISAGEKGWTRWFVQPIPVLESLRLRRFTTTPGAQEILRRNLRGFGARLVFVLLPVVLTFGCWELWRRSDGYQIEQVVEAATDSVDALADKNDREDIAVVADWAEALLLGGREAEAQLVWQKMKDGRAKSDSQASVTSKLVRAGRLDEAMLFADRLLRDKDLIWDTVWAKAVNALAEAASPDLRYNALISLLEEIHNLDHRATALRIAAEAMARSGKANEAAAVFGKTDSVVSRMEVDARAKARGDLASGVCRARLVDDCLRIVRAAVVESRKAKDRAGVLFASAILLEELGKIDEAMDALREGLGAVEGSWSGAWRNQIVQVAIGAEKAGKASEVLTLAREDQLDRSDSFGGRRALLAALLVTGHRDEILADIAGLREVDWLGFHVLAIKHLVLMGKNAEAKVLLEEAVAAVPAWFAERVNFEADIWKRDLINAAADIGDPVLLGKVISSLDFIGGAGLSFYEAMALGMLMEDRRIDLALASTQSIEERNARLLTLASLLSRAYLVRPLSSLSGPLNRLLLEAQKTPDLPDDTLERVSLALAEGGQVKVARSLVARMKEGRDKALASIATACASGGRFDAALRMTEELKANRILRSQTLASIVVEAVDRGDDRSLALLPEIEYPSDVSRARSAIAKWQARSGELSAARAMAEKCSPADKLGAYTELVMEYALRRGKIPSREALAPAAPDQVEYPEWL